MNILALDPSLTCVGGVDIGGEPFTIQSKKKGVERLWEIRYELAPRIARADIVVAEEQPKHGRSQAGVIGRAELYGVLRLNCFDQSIPFSELNPSTVKVFATGRGNASKPEVFSSAIRRIGYDGTSEDEADALWIWHLAHYAMGSENYLSLPLTHLRALEAAKRALSISPPDFSKGV